MYNIIIEYKPKSGYLESRREIEKIMEKLEASAEVDLLVPGWIILKTDMPHKAVIEEVEDRFSMNPEFVKTTLRWIPVDYWCEPKDVPAKVKEEYGDILLAKDRYCIMAEAHNVDADLTQLKKDISAIIPAKLEPDPIEKILRIDIFTKGTAIAIIGRHSIFRA